jgi:hypothetical protein
MASGAGMVESVTARMLFRILSSSLVFLAISFTSVMAQPASAPSADFVGPSGWSHAAPNTADPNRTIQQWHISGDVTSLTFVKDTSTTYDAAIGALVKNFTTNNIKPTTDRDVPCRGKTSHIVEFSIGPDGHQIIIHRMVVPDGAGVDTVTYARSVGVAFDPDVKKSETMFCGAATP